MAKKVTVWLKNGDKKEYENVSRIEEEKEYDKLISIRLYEGGGLRVVLSSETFDRFEAVDQT